MYSMPNTANLLYRLVITPEDPERVRRVFFRDRTFGKYPSDLLERIYKKNNDSRFEKAIKALWCSSAVPFSKHYSGRRACSLPYKGGDERWISINGAETRPLFFTKAVGDAPLAPLFLRGTMREDTVIKGADGHYYKIRFQSRGLIHPEDKGLWYAGRVTWNRKLGYWMHNDDDVYVLTDDGAVVAREIGWDLRREVL